MKLIITVDDVRQITPVRGSVSSDYIEPCIDRAQDLKLAYVIGYPLMQKLVEVVEAGETNKYSELIENFVRKYLAWATAFYLLPDIAVKIGAAGVQDSVGGQGNSVFEGQMALIRQNIMNSESAYKKLLIMHLCKDTSLYPEFLQYELGRQSKTDGNQSFYTIENY